MAKAKGKKKTEVLDYGAQVRSLREQGPGRLYLLWGREDYLREQYLIELKKLCLPGSESGKCNPCQIKSSILLAKLNAINASSNTRGSFFFQLIPRFVRYNRIKNNVNTPV